MRIAVDQSHPAVGDVSVKLARLSARLDAIPAIDLLLLPELWGVGYFHFDRYATSLGAEQQLLDGLRGIASDRHIWIHTGSQLTNTKDGRAQNTSFVLDRDGREAARYSKRHVFGYESREPDLVAAGTDLSVVDIEGLRFGLAICYDLRFPEHFRQLVDQGAEAFLVPATWPAARREHWDLLLRARAVENVAVTVGCNAAGSFAGVQAGGSSAVISPTGQAIAHAGSEPETLVVDIDPELVSIARRGFPALRDRMPAVIAAPKNGEDRVATSAAI